MKLFLMTKKMIWIVIALLPSLPFPSAKAQDTLVLDIGKALEIALSENPTVKVANKEIRRKNMRKKVHMPLYSPKSVLQPTTTGP